MAEKCSCVAGEEVRLVFPCSGGADVGELADRAARKLNEAGTAQMYCLAGIGGRVSGIVESTRAAGLRLVIDGCPLRCASRTLQEAGMAVDCQICVTDLGFTKGETDVTSEAIAGVVDAAERTLNR